MGSLARALLAFAFLATAALGQGEAAKQVRAAFEANDAEKLKALAAKDDPDPWLVADALCAEGAFAAAEAFAKAAPRYDTKELPAYVAARRDEKRDPAARALLDKINALNQARKHEELLELLPEFVEGRSVNRIRVAHGRGIALLLVGERDAEAATQLLSAADAAARIGWHRRAGTLVWAAGVAHRRTGDLDAALRAFERAASIARKRGDRNALALALDDVGGIHIGRNEYARAIEVNERLLPLLEELGDEKALRNALQGTGNMWMALDRPEKGVPLLERALALAKEDADVAESCQDLARSKSLRRRWSEVLAYAHRALALYEKLGDREGQADTLEYLALALDGEGKRAEAHATFERALGLRRELKDARGVAAMQARIAGLYILSDPHRAVGYFRRAVELYEEVGDEAKVADELHGLGLSARASGDLELARASYERAVALHRKRGDLVKTAEQLLQLANTLRDQGDLKQALVRCREAAALAERPDFLEGGTRLSVDPRANARIDALLMEENLERAAGRPRAALALARRALALATAADEVSDQAECHRDLGRILDDLGRYDEALRHYEQCLVSARRVNEPVFIHDARLGIGRIHQTRGDYDAALAAFEAVLAAHERSGNRFGITTCLTDIGHVHRSRGDYDRALACFEKSLAFARSREHDQDEASSLNNISLVHESRGEYTKALEVHRRVLSFREKTADARGVADSLNNMGNVYYEQGEFAKALACHERALAIREKLGLRQLVADSLGNIAAVYKQWDRYDEALAHFRRVFAMEEELGDRAGAATMLQNIGTVYADLSRHEEAVDHYQRALTIYRELGNPHGIAGCLNNLGLEFEDLGDTERAGEALLEALAIFEGLGEPSGVAMACNGLGGFFHNRGDLEASLAYFDRSEKIARKTGNHPQYVKVLVNRALVFIQQGDFGRALADLHEGLRMEEKYRSRESVAVVLQALGNLYVEKGEYPTALRYYERCLSMREELGDRGEIADIKYNIGLVCKDLGELERAERSFSQALEVARDLGERDSTGHALAALGTLATARGDLKRARVYFEESLEIAEQLRRPSGISVACSNLALVCQKQERWDRARELLEHSVAIGRKTGRGAATALDLSNLGDLHRICRRYEEAEKCLRESLAIAERLGSERVAFNARWNLALLYEERGRNDEALALAQRALRSYRRMAGGLSDKQSALLRERWRNFFTVACKAAIGAGDSVALCEFLETERAGALLEALGGRERLRAAALPPELRRREEKAEAVLAERLRAYQAAVKKGNRAAIKQRRTALDLARDGVEDIIGRIQREAKAEADVLYPSPAPLADLQATLRPGEALVVLKILIDNVYAFVVTRDAAHGRRLGDAEKTLRACRALVVDAKAPDVDRIAERLRELVVKPLRLGDGVNRLLLSPQGALSYIPFTLIASEYELAYVPSGSTYRTLRGQSRERGEAVLALGDPAVGTGRSFLRGSELGRLPASADEARAVGDAVLVGDDANESTLAARLGERRRWRSVHLACHAVVDPERPLFSALALTPAGESDGFLTTLDVFRMKIPADLVVLSACETAKGRVYHSEGVVGFTRAFMFAGAPRVICSLWKVDDEATRALMVKFYELWNPEDGSEALSTAAALRAAQKHVRRMPRWRHPYYWAAWQLWGVPD